MHGIAVARTIRNLGRLLSHLVILGSVVLGAAPYAAASEVQTIICRAPSSVTIDRPVNDTVVTTAGVRIDGTVRQANQLEVYVDGALDNVVPLSAAATTYTAAVQLQSGTHTIKVTAIDACQIGNPDASVVLTYQPAVPQPSVGSAVPTIVGSEAGVRVGDTQVKAAPAPSFLPPAISRPLQQLSDTLNLSPTSDAAGRQSFSQATRLVLVLAGGSALIFSQAISSYGVSGRVLQFIASRIGLHAVSASRLLAILIGVGGIVLAFLL